MLNNKEFDWDPNKREEVLNNRGIDFKDAANVFDGRLVITSPSNQPGEARWITTSELNGKMISVIWTYRGSIIRIITVRRARKNEERKFYKSVAC